MQIGLSWFGLETMLDPTDIRARNNLAALRLRLVTDAEDSYFQSVVAFTGVSPRYDFRRDSDERFLDILKSFMTVPPRSTTVQRVTSRTIIVGSLSLISDTSNWLSLVKILPFVVEEFH